MVTLRPWSLVSSAAMSKLSVFFFEISCLQPSPAAHVSVISSWQILLMQEFVTPSIPLYLLFSKQFLFPFFFYNDIQHLTSIDLGSFQVIWQTFPAISTDIQLFPSFPRVTYSSSASAHRCNTPFMVFSILLLLSIAFNPQYLQCISQLQQHMCW